MDAERHGGGERVGAQNLQSLKPAASISSGCANEDAPAGKPERVVEQIKLVAGEGSQFLCNLLSIGAGSCVAHEISSLPWFFLLSCR